MKFVIGLNKFRPFSFLVNTFGSIGGAEEIKELGWNYQMDSTVQGASVEIDESSTIYLPNVQRD